MVRVVGERVQSYMGDHFYNQRVSDAIGTCFIQIGIGQHTTLVDDLDRKLGQSIIQRVFGNLLSHRGIGRSLLAS